jgi:hypothetical protein
MRLIESKKQNLERAASADDVKQLISFLGAVGSYMRFVPHFADIVEPLRISPEMRMPLNSVFKKEVVQTSPNVKKMCTIRAGQS